MSKDKPFQPQDGEFGVEDWFMAQGMPMDSLGVLWDRYIDSCPGTPVPRSLFDTSVKALQSHYGTKRNVGRPSTYSVEVADIICGRILAGESLRSICRDDAMPCGASVFKWLREHNEFAEQYAKAKAEQAEGYADEIVEISDEKEYDKVEVDGVLVGVRFDSTAVARNRLRVDTRKWVASKLLPKKYGDKVQLSNDPDNPFQPATFIMQPVAAPERED